MHIEILSKLVITKIYSVSTMYSESGRKIKRINRPNWAILIKYEGENSTFIWKHPCEDFNSLFFQKVLDIFY